MTDQLYIDQDGSIQSEPLTWDGEPLYSPASVQEGLFETDAFSQFRGQQALETDAAPEIDNSAEAVEQRRAMFRGFGWGVS